MIKGFDLEIIIKVGANGRDKKEAIQEVESYLPKIKTSLAWLKEELPMPYEAFEVKIKSPFRL